ncbi:MAG: T9SS type A sorting domain-containing protein [Candidatus Eisenbacteria bacterium]|uniref:T9SS type A sorting domain-containing protein n=1 Tax=Eiseniibacteriota bacterium TaxID=2212470 RepID=A0A956RQK5_UNCEI|nr:T9SS type A sorting domain-containing protein [Candidatus Eisenbacteria bacterium]
MRVSFLSARGLRAVIWTSLFAAVSWQTAAHAVPPADHILVVIMENHSYDQVRTAPYTAGLIAANSVCSESYGVTHPSQPNYLALWSGGTQGVVNDACPPPGSPYVTANLGQACEAAGVSWRAYSEDLPSAGYTGCTAAGGLYVRKHAPWVNFSNLDHTRERPYTDLATDIANGTLPRLGFVVPNQCNNTHDCPVATGDTWLANNLPQMIEGVGPDGFVVLTWDEDNSASGNHILTVFAGSAVIAGADHTGHVDHYTVLRTICDALEIPAFGLAAGRLPIDDIWSASAGVPQPETSVGVRLGPVYPNPSTHGFRAHFSSPASAPVRAGIFDAAGRLVVPLSPRDGTLIEWDGNDGTGRQAGSGLYFLRLQSGSVRTETKVIVIE